MDQCLKVCVAMTHHEYQRMIIYLYVGDWKNSKREGRGSMQFGLAPKNSNTPFAPSLTGNNPGDKYEVSKYECFFIMCDLQVCVVS